MKKINLIVIFILINNILFSQKTNNITKCSKLYKNNFSTIIQEKYITLSDKDTITFNELRFECVYAYSYSQHAMYNKFGKWNQMIFSAGNNYPILMWEKVDLFSNGEKYDVFAYGNEEWKHTYASVIVLDNKGKDVLTKNSPILEKMKSYFGNLIINSTHQKNDFYKAFEKFILPEITKRKQ